MLLTTLMIASSFGNIITTEAKYISGINDNTNDILLNQDGQRGENKPFTLETIFYSQNYDGYIDNGGSVSYSQIRTAPQGTTVSTSVSFITVDQGWTPSLDSRFGDYWIDRGFLYFYTDSLPENAVITSATLSLWGVDNYDSTYIVIQSGQPDHPQLTLSTSDYNYLYYQNSGDGGDFNTATWSNTGYNVFTLNSVGLPWIQKQGYTKLCLRELGDINGNAPSASIGVTFQSSEGTHKPKLIVDYIIPPEVSTLDATDITSTSATLNGNLDDMGGDSSCDVWFDIGTDTSYGSTTPSQEKTSTGPFAYGVGGLTHGVTYHFRAEGSNTAGTGAPGQDKTFFTNRPPNCPSNPVPSKGETGVHINTILSWDGGDIDGDTVYYDVYLDKQNPPSTCVSYHQTGTSYATGTLDYNTHYYWEIYAYDPWVSVGGPVWDFQTESPVPPNYPVAKSPTDGATGVSIYTQDLTCTISHPNHYSMTVYFYWNQETTRTDVQYNQPDGSDVTFTIPIPTDKELYYNTVYHWKIIVVDPYEGTATKEFSFTTEAQPADIFDITGTSRPWNYLYSENQGYWIYSSADSQGNIEGINAPGVWEGGYWSVKAKLGNDFTFNDPTYVGHFVFGMTRAYCTINQCSITDSGWSQGIAKIRLFYNIYYDNNPTPVETNDLFVREKQATSDDDSFQLPNMQNIIYLEDSLRFLDPINDYFLENHNIKIEFWMELSVSKAYNDYVDVRFSATVTTMELYGYRPDLKVNGDSFQMNPVKPSNGEPVTVSIKITNGGKCRAFDTSQNILTQLKRDSTWISPDNSRLSLDIGETPTITWTFTWPDNQNHYLNFATDVTNNYNEADEYNNLFSQYVKEFTGGFQAGTQILLVNGQSKNIEMVHVGDQVLAYDQVSGITVPAIVTYVHRYQQQYAIHDFVIINNNFRVTTTHPLFINGAWRTADTVRVGDTLLRITPFNIQPQVVTSVSRTRLIIDCYALEVTGQSSTRVHNYVANNILVGE